MPFICKTCAQDDVLQGLAHQTLTGEHCVLCEQRRETVIDLEARRTRQVLRSLLRYYFDEWEYNIHFGGDSIDELLSRPNPILAHSNPEGVETLCGEAFQPGYEGADLGVSLFAGHANDEQLPLLEALQRATDPFLRETRRRLQIENHFRLKMGVQARLELHRSHIAQELADRSFARARIGFQSRGMHWDTHQFAYVPHSERFLLAPPPPAASSGRINRSGVSFLYVASDVATAIAEVRPHPGHLVSTGQVRQTEHCLIADFSQIGIIDFSSSDAGLDEFVFLRTIERDFATPVVPEERDNYLLGQLVADVLREMGFQGIAYRSSISQGTNFCFFDPSKFEYVTGSGEVTEVRTLQYATEPKTAIPELAEPYVAI